MRKLPLVLGLICLAIAAVIFVFAEGARRIYSGVFFLMLAVAILADYWRGKRDSSK